MNSMQKERVMTSPWPSPLSLSLLLPISPYWAINAEPVCCLWLLPSGPACSWKWTKVLRPLADTTVDSGQRIPAPVTTQKQQHYLSVHRQTLFYCLPVWVLNMVTLIVISWCAPTSNSTRSGHILKCWPIARPGRRHHHLISHSATLSGHWHLSQIHSAAPLGNQATSTMTWYPTQPHYPDTELSILSLS